VVLFFDQGLNPAGLSGRWARSYTISSFFLLGGATGNPRNCSEKCGSLKNVSSSKAGCVSSTTSSGFSVRLTLVFRYSLFVLISVNTGHGSSFQTMAFKRGFIRFTLTN
jgi:hypothetical protein